MSRSVELSDEDYARLERVAEVEAITPAEWVARHLPACPETQPCANGKPAESLAGRFAGPAGVVDPGPHERLSERQTENGGGGDEVSRLLAIPEPVYAAIEQVARARGLTPLTWIIGHLPAPQPTPAPDGAKPRTMAERLAGRIGKFSGSKGIPSSDNVAQSFAEHLEAKQREGRL